MVYIFAGCFLIFLIWGISFIIRGLKDSALEKTAIPIEDLKEIREIKETLVSPEPGDSSHEPIIPKISENTQPPDASVAIEPSVTLGLSRKLKQAQESLEKLTKENQRLAQALELEMSIQKNVTESQDKQQDFEELKGKFKQLSEKFEVLSKEKQDAESRYQSAQEKILDMERQVAQARNEFQSQSGQAQSQIGLLEQELQSLKEEEKKAKHDRELLEHLKKDNQKLLDQLRESAGDIGILRENIETLAKTSQQKLSVANEIIKELREKIRLDQVSEAQMVQQQTQKVDDMVQILSREKDELQAKNNELEAQIKKIKEFNGYLLEKEKRLQFELTKSRAQAMGMEKICDDLKVAIESKHKVAS